MKSKLFILFVMGFFILSSCIPKQPTPKMPKKEIITKEKCITAGGNWNECGSPCAGTDAEVCIQVCSAQCECGGIERFKCPEGFKCRLSGKKINEVGVCVEG